MDDIKKVWFQKGKSWECYACKPPYAKEDIIEEGLPYEIWIKTPTLEEEKNE
jgi:hypothetical protein